MVVACAEESSCLIHRLFIKPQHHSSRKFFTTSDHPLDDAIQTCTPSTTESSMPWPWAQTRSLSRYNRVKVRHGLLLSTENISESIANLSLQYGPVHRFISHRAVDDQNAWSEPVRVVTRPAHQCDKGRDAVSPSAMRLSMEFIVVVDDLQETLSLKRPASDWGLYLCSSKGKGFHVSFLSFRVILLTATQLTTTQPQILISRRSLQRCVNLAYCSIWTRYPPAYQAACCKLRYREIWPPSIAGRPLLLGCNFLENIDCRHFPTSIASHDEPVLTRSCRDLKHNDRFIRCESLGGLQQNRHSFHPRLQCVLLANYPGCRAGILWILNAT